MSRRDAVAALILAAAAGLVTLAARGQEFAASPAP